MKDYQLDLLEQKLKQCKNIRLEDVDVDKIEEISIVEINSEKSSIDRMLDFLELHENPYMFKVNGIVVQFEFSDETNITATTCISNALKNEYTKTNKITSV